MFLPDVDLAPLTGHISYMFHCTIGLDPLGDFTAVEGLSYEMDRYDYKELGRNHSPVSLPFDGPGRPGEITLRWGMIIRSKLFSWMDKVRVGGDYRKNVYIFQLSQLRLPFRVYHLTGCWPKQWEASNLTTESPAEMSTEQLTLVYDQLDMLNLSAVAMAGALLADPVSDLLNQHRPKAYRPKAMDGDLRNTGVKYVAGRPVGPTRIGTEDAYVAVAGDVDREAEAAEAKKRTEEEEKALADKVLATDQRNTDAAEAKKRTEEEEEALKGIAGSTDAERSTEAAEGVREIEGADTKNTKGEAAEGKRELKGADTKNTATEAAKAGTAGTDGARATAGSSSTAEERKKEDAADAEEAVERRSRDADPDEEG